ncbi:putative chloroperoxidase [Exidia glandulosa HHB12029]|uniref:Putative chloroperoxidase n=1 Tax=Exidia glandulosa HHB12029 TaxID=1314781 RepID=A0A165NG89_EXIGL|nr:putative chloroperoxidase [Exidia glandulosa HHB12029]
MWFTNACSRIGFGLYALAAKALSLPLLLGSDIVITILNAVTRGRPTGHVVDLWPEGQRHLWPRYEPPKPTDSRSPCVALNCMANMGILPRDGRNIAFPDLERAVMRTYNTSRTFATLVTRYAATMLLRDFEHDTLDLSDLCVHNGIEHDGSFTRHDTYLQPDQSKPAEELVTFVLSSATGRNKLGEPRLTVSDLITISTKRRADCRVENPQFTQTFFHKILGSSNRATLTDIFGGNVKDLGVILRQERLPEGWEPSNRSRFGITIHNVNATVLAVELGIKEERGPRRIQLHHGL